METPNLNAADTRRTLVDAMAALREAHAWHDEALERTKAMIGSASEQVHARINAYVDAMQRDPSPTRA